MSLQHREHFKPPTGANSLRTNGSGRFHWSTPIPTLALAQKWPIAVMSHLDEVTCFSWILAYRVETAAAGKCLRSAGRVRTSLLLMRCSTAHQRRRDLPLKRTYPHLECEIPPGAMPPGKDEDLTRRCVTHLLAAEPSLQQSQHNPPPLPAFLPHWPLCYPYNYPSTFLTP